MLKLEAEHILFWPFRVYNVEKTFELYGFIKFCLLLLLDSKFIEQKMRPKFLLF